MSLLLLAIDPGPTESAWVVWDGERIIEHGKAECAEVLNVMRSGRCLTHVVCERIRSYGMPAGAELFETAEWCGRYQQAAVDQGIQWCWMTRKDVKLNLCGQTRAKDANIRQAIIDRFGGSIAIGRKASPGPLYGTSGDVWAALAVALTWCDLRTVGVPHA